MSPSLYGSCNQPTNTTLSSFGPQRTWKEKKKNHISVSRFLIVIGPSGIQLGLESYERLTSKSDGRKREAHLLITRTTLDNIFTMEKLLPTCQNKDNF